MYPKPDAIVMGAARRKPVTDLRTYGRTDGHALLKVTPKDAISFVHKTLEENNKAQHFCNHRYKQTDGRSVVRLDQLIETRERIYIVRRKTTPLAHSILIFRTEDLSI